MTALSESFSLMIIRDVFPLMILTFLHFSWVRKPVLDISNGRVSEERGIEVFEEHPNVGDLVK